MRRFATVLTAAALLGGAVAAAPANESQETGAPAEPTHTFEMAPGDAETFAGQVPFGFYAGLAAVRDNLGTYPDCSSDVPGVFYCESVLVSVTGGEVTEDGTILASLAFDLVPDTAAGDFDIRVYHSDADGTVGEEAGRTTELVTDVQNESIKFKVRTTVEEPTRWYLAVIDYWAAVGNYTMDVSVS